MKNFLFSAILMLFLFSCVKESLDPCKTITTWSLEEDVRNWKKYTENERFNLSDSADTITVQCTNRKHGLEEIQVGFCPPDINEYIRMDFEVSKLSDPIELEISYSNRMTLLNGDLTLYASKESSFGLVDKGSASFRDSLTIKGRYYYDVFNFEYTIDSLQFNHLVYSTTNGIILLEINHTKYTAQ